MQEDRHESRLRWRAIVCTSSIVAMSSLGCGPGRPPPLTPATLKPAAVAEAIFTRCDADGDKRLTTEEREAASAVKAAAKELDTDGDGSVSFDELVHWLESVRQSRIAISSLSVEVRHNGQLVGNARVHLTPDPAMGGAIQDAEGVTDDSGIAVLSVVGAGTPGVNCGLYDVTIDLAGASPADDARAATFGVAVGAGLPPGYMASFEVQDKGGPPNRQRPPSRRKD